MPDDQRPICFVISPIGKDGTDTRKRSNQVFKYIIEPAAEVCGYKTLRADKISEPGVITSQIIQHVIDDPLVIADLSDHNANVFYELAIRHALRKPYVQMIHKAFTMPFDLSVTRTVMFDHQDLDDVEDKKQELVNHIKAVQGLADVDSPISNAIDVEHLRRSGNPEERQMAEVLYGINSLASQVSTLSDALRKVEYLVAPPDVFVVPPPSLFAKKLQEAWKKDIVSSDDAGSSRLKS